MSSPASRRGSGGLQVGLPDEPDLAAHARALAARLGVACIRCDEMSPDALFLKLDSAGLSLARAGQRGEGVRIDWRTRTHPRRISARSQDPLLRSVGPRTRSICDATAGYGGDAFNLALHGHRVTALERDPVLALLLEDALQRARRDPELREAAERIELHAADSIEWLQSPDHDYAVILLDPMFPPKRRASALPRLPMQILQELVGDDPDSDRLFACARECAIDRVVVKRPSHAPPLGAKPSFSHEGKLTRFDVYLRPRTSA